jgi:carnitine O-palmitoyltransferase 2
MDSSDESTLNFEHAWDDGVAVLRYFNEVFNDHEKNPVVHPDTTYEGLA